MVGRRRAGRLAVTHAGLAAVSRANARDGAAELAEFLRDWPRGREVVFVADADENEVGTDGATAVAAQLAESLGRTIRVVTPPDGAKDARAWLTHPDRAETPWAERGKQLLRHIEITADVMTRPRLGRVPHRPPISNRSGPRRPPRKRFTAWPVTSCGLSNRRRKPTRWRCRCNCW